MAIIIGSTRPGRYGEAVAQWVYDIASKKLSAKIPVGKCPNWFAMSSDGKYVAVTNAESNSTSIIDAKTHKVLAEVPVGKGPKRIEFVDVPEVAS